MAFRFQIENVICQLAQIVFGALLGLDVDADVRAWLKSPEYLENPQCWWPGFRTPFKEVHLLLPSQCLALRSGRVHSYWTTSDRVEEMFG